MEIMDAHKEYSKMCTDRQTYLDMGYEAAELTIPFLLPRNNIKGQVLSKAYQSLGSRLVNTLSSKLLLSQFPPNSPFFKYQIDDFTLEKLKRDRGLVEEALSSMERAVTQEVDSKAMRIPLFETLRHLIVTGNMVVNLTPENTLRVFHLDQYVIKRDPEGLPIKALVQEIMSHEVYKEIFGSTPPQSNNNSENTKEDAELNLYTTILYDGSTNKYTVKQSVNGKSVGKPSTYPKDKLPWMFLRFNSIDGEDYGRGLVEENIGDLRAFNGLSKNILDAAAASSKVVFLISPNSTLTATKLASVENLGFLSGVREEVQALQVDKFNDLNMASQLAQNVEGRLAAAFLLNQSVQRQAERVTAEEIRFLANELESSLGGIYSLLSHELQLPLVVGIIANLERAKKLPEMPRDTVKPVIITGFEALGRSNDSQKILTMAKELMAAFGPEAIASQFIMGETIKRVGSGMSIDMKGLIKTPEQLQEEQEAAQQQNVQMEAMKALGPNAVNQVGALQQQNQAKQPPQE